MDRWRGKVAVVTGAASGIGAAIAKKLLDAGIDVVGLDIQRERLREQAIDYQNNKSNGSFGTLHALECDISKEDELEKAFRWVDENLGGAQILVNNVGVTCYKPIIDSERADFERLLNINVIAMASCIAKAVRSMRVNKVEGHIFNINSKLGHELPEGTLTELEGANGWNLYPASKHASVAMTHGVRREIARIAAPIRITSISPGLVKTDITKHNEALKNFFDKIPSLNPSDIADALIYALSTRPEVQISELTVIRTGEF